MASNILVYALHYEGAINKNSLGAVSEGARLAGELGGECHVLVLGGDDLTDELCGSLGAHGASKVLRVERARGAGPARGRRDGAGHGRRRPPLRAVRRRPARLRDRRRAWPRGWTPA